MTNFKFYLSDDNFNWQKMTHITLNGKIHKNISLNDFNKVDSGICKNHTIFFFAKIFL